MKDINWFSSSLEYAEKTKSCIDLQKNKEILKEYRTSLEQANAQKEQIDKLVELANNSLHKVDASLITSINKSEDMTDTSWIQSSTDFQTVLKALLFSTDVNVLYKTATTGFLPKNSKDYSVKVQSTYFNS